MRDLGRAGGMWTWRFGMYDFIINSSSQLASMLCSMHCSLNIALKPDLTAQDSNTNSCKIKQPVQETVTP